MLPALVLLALGAATGCSNFAMEDSYRLSGRTEDLGAVNFTFGMVTRPAGMPGLQSNSTRHGLVGFLKLQPLPMTLDVSQGIKGGINDAGLSCDKQTLKPTEFPAPSRTAFNLDAALVCRWALESFRSVSELKGGLRNINIVAPKLDQEFDDGHYIFRDAAGDGLVLEFEDGMMHIYNDGNDGGISGFGVLTNEPNFRWQVTALKHLQWKMKRTAPLALDIPGSWYPEARFQRLWLVKSEMPAPENYQDAVMQAWKVLNTVSVPQGTQLGKDNEFDSTHWAVVWDHINATVYFRTRSNQSLQRVRLADADIGVGGKMSVLPLSSPALPFFNDAAAELFHHNASG